MKKTLGNLIRTFNNQFNERIKTSYSYEPLKFLASTSIYNAKKQEFVDSVPASVLGVYQSNSTSDEKYLYDRPPLRYDSADPELKILQRSYGPKISVFGKLPKKRLLRFRVLIMERLHPTLSLRLNMVISQFI